jgi:hypothetical protein
MRVAERNRIALSAVVQRMPMLVACGLVISGCSQGFENVRSENRAKLYRLEVGQTRQQVLEEMGTEPQAYNKGVFRSEGIVPNPYASETHLLGTTEVEVLYYATNVKNSDGVITNDELTPIVLVDGILVGWGWTYLQTFTADNDLTLDGPEAPPEDGEAPAADKDS